MKRSVTWILTAILLATMATTRSRGADLYVLTNNTPDLSGTTTTLGKINLDNGAFTKINITGDGSNVNGDIIGAAGNLARINTIGEENFLYFTLGTGTATILKRLNLATNQIDGFSTSPPNPGGTIMGMTYGGDSLSNTFYAWKQEGEGLDEYGTISTTTGEWATLTNNPGIDTTNITTGGRLANLGGTIYGAFNGDTIGKFGKFGTSSPYQFEWLNSQASEPEYKNMVLAADSDASTLYGVFGSGTGQKLYTINTGNGALTDGPNISGAGIYFHGAAFVPVPEPSTYALGMIAAGTAGWTMRRKKKHF